MGDKDIYAGGYQHTENGAVDPASKDYRYIIQNDLKFIYATNPFAAGGTASSSNYKTPQGGAFLAVFNGYTNTFEVMLNSIRDDTPKG